MDDGESDYRTSRRLLGWALPPFYVAGVMGTALIVRALASIVDFRAIGAKVGEVAVMVLAFVLAVIRFDQWDRPLQVGLFLVGVAALLVCCWYLMKFIFKTMAVVWGGLGLFYSTAFLWYCWRVWGFQKFKASIWPGICGAASFIATNMSYEAWAGLMAAVVGIIVYKNTSKRDLSLSMAALTFVTAIAEAAFETHEHLSKPDTIPGLSIYMCSMFIFGYSMSRELGQHWHVRAFAPIPIDSVSTNRSAPFLTTLNLTMPETQKFRLHEGRRSRIKSRAA